MAFSDLETLAGHFQAARYGAIFFESEGSMTESLLRLTRDLNEGRRFVALELGSPGNASGAKSVLTWQSGAPSAVDFCLGYPRHLPREATLENRLEAGEVDAVLLVIGSLSARPGAELAAKLGSIPSILIGPESEIAPTPTVAFRTARPGIESGGTVGRVDGVMLPLRPVVTTNLPTDREILDAICERLKF
jgi:formylmethanofuran dehydrogenase subunit B